MCSPVNTPTWNIHPDQRCPVGFIDEENHFILLSDGEDPNGTIFNLWAPTDNNTLFIIDILAKENGTWSYTRQYQCNNLECISETFLRIINPAL